MDLSITSQISDDAITAVSFISNSTIGSIITIDDTDDSSSNEQDDVRVITPEQKHAVEIIDCDLHYSNKISKPCDISPSIKHVDNVINNVLTKLPSGATDNQTVSKNLNVLESLKTVTLQGINNFSSSSNSLGENAKNIANKVSPAPIQHRNVLIRKTKTTGDPQNYRSKLIRKIKLKRRMNFTKSTANSLMALQRKTVEVEVQTVLDPFVEASLNATSMPIPAAADNVPSVTQDAVRTWYPQNGLPSSGEEIAGRSPSERSWVSMDCDINAVDLTVTSEDQLLGNNIVEKNAQHNNFHPKVKLSQSMRELQVVKIQTPSVSNSVKSNIVDIPVNRLHNTTTTPKRKVKHKQPNFRPGMFKWGQNRSPYSVRRMPFRPPVRRRFFDPKLQVVIMAGDCIRKCETNDIRSRLVERLTGWTEGPSFNDSGLRYERWFQVSCANLDSALWLVKQDLGFLNGRRINIMPLSEAPYRPVASMFFKNSPHNIMRTMELLKMQNYRTGLAINMWKVVRYIRVPKGLQLIINIDITDIPILLKLDFCIYFELHLIPVRLWNRDRPWGRAPLLTPPR